MKENFLLTSYIDIQFSLQTLCFTVISGGQEVTGSVCALLALLITWDTYVSPLQKLIHYLSLLWKPYIICSEWGMANIHFKYNNLKCITEVR